MIYWLLPLAFVVHDAEELFTMPSWFIAHERPLGLAHVAVAIALFLVIFLVITAGAWLRPRSFAWRALYGGLLGTFLLHGFIHVGQAIAFASYTPGLVTAVLVVVPASTYLWIVLLRRGAIDLKPSLAMSVLGIALFLPAVLGALWLSSQVLSSFS